jgi:hypothetical protein
MHFIWAVRHTADYVSESVTAACWRTSPLLTHGMCEMPGGCGDRQRSTAMDTGVAADIGSSVRLAATAAIPA